MFKKSHGRYNIDTLICCRCICCVWYALQLILCSYSALHIMSCNTYRTYSSAAVYGPPRFWKGPLAAKVQPLLRSDFLQGSLVDLSSFGGFGHHGFSLRSVATRDPGPQLRSLHAGSFADFGIRRAASQVLDPHGKNMLGSSAGWCCQYLVFLVIMFLVFFWSKVRVLIAMRI